MISGTEKLTLALTKGRVLKETLPLLQRAGIEPLEDISKSRKLLIATNNERLQLLVMRGVDVPAYVRHGAAHLGVVGKDVLLEQGSVGIYEPLDLEIAPCRLMTAATVGFLQPTGRIRVATKIINEARDFFARQGLQVELIKLYGAMELATLAGREVAFDLEQSLHAVSARMPEANAILSGLAQEFGVFVLGPSGPVFDADISDRPVNRAHILAPDGRVVVYMGDDERGEFLYKYVSNGVYTPGGPTSELLDDGQLYVAKFDNDLTGRWVALTPEATGMDEAEIAIFTRMAASNVGATTMDRPEWVAVNTVAAEGYCCLTNNRNRGVKPNAGGDDTSVNGPNPRAENYYGQIVRWYPSNDDHAADTFTWDLYVMAGNPTVHGDKYGGSANINEGNLFNSPDGMMFDSTGLGWIQTDGDYDNEGDFVGMGNNQMLAGDPVTGQIERFLTGPYGCEVTGLTWAADLRTMFVGIQHPAAPFPDGEGMLPRSSIIAIKRDDNLPVG